jgi:hypothetical protein
MNRILMAGACALLLTGCSSKSGSTIGNLIAFNSPTAPPVVSMEGPRKVECPSIDVLEGGASKQIGSGPSLRHQFALGDMSRECTVLPNGQIAIRVGVSGRVVAGPAGGPGSFTVPIKVGIRDESNQRIVTSKVYNVSATIPSGSLNTGFELITEPLYIPFTREEANEDYMVVVGIEGTGGQSARRSR